MKSRTYACAKCGQPIPYAGSGRPPKFHPECGDSKNRAKRLKTLATRAASVGIEVQAQQSAGAIVPLDEETQAAVERAKTAARPELMAIGLAISDDPEQAAASVGLEGTAEELRALAKTARRRHADLVEMRPAQLGRLIQQTMFLNALHARVNASRVAPGQVAAFLKSAAQSLELVQGGTHPAYATIELVLPGVADATETPK